MITFSILLAGVLALLAIATVVVLTVGGSLIVVLGDIIVCGLIFWALLKLLKRKKK